MDSKTRPPKKDRVELDPQVQESADMLEYLDGRETQMTDWEIGFYTNITDWFYNQGKPLTDPQYDSLVRLYNRLCN